MNEGTLYRCDAHARAAEALGEGYEAWRKGHAEAMAVRDLEGWIADALAMADHTHAFLASVVKGLEQHPPANPARPGQAMLRVHDALAGLLGTVADGLAWAEGLGYRVERAEELRRAVRRAALERQEFRRTWPTDPDGWERARREIANDEADDIDDVLAGR